MDNYLYAINPNGTIKWKVPINVYSDENYTYASPVVGPDGTIYVGDFDNYLNAISPDGKIKWRYKTGEWVRSTAVIGKDGTIYFGSSDGYLYALDSNGRLLWKTKPGESEGFGSSGTVSAEGVLYIGNWDGNLYAIMVSSEGIANSPWPKFKGNLRNTGRFGDN